MCRCMLLLIVLFPHQRQEDGKLQMSDLPDDVLREILLRLADHQDLVSAGQADSRTFSLSEDNFLWRDLCLFHFSKNQWHSVVRKGEDLETLDWKILYPRLVKLVFLLLILLTMLLLFL